MKLSSTVLILFITLLCILPFFWFTYLGKKASGKSKKTIKDLLNKENFNFSQKEFWNHNFIGIDEQKNTLVFVKAQSPENEKTIINLGHVKSCTIQKTTLEFKREKKVESELQTLDLELVVDANKTNILLNFYNIQDQLSEDFEMKRAEHWKLLISNAVQNKHSSVKAA